LAFDALQLSRVCDSILLIDGVGSCTIFDPQGRKVDAKVKGSSGSDVSSKYGSMIGGTVVGGLKPVEPFTGKLSSAVVVFEGFKAVVAVAESGMSVVVTVPISTDAEYVRRMIRSEFMRREAEVSWGIQKLSR